MATRAVCDIEQGLLHQSTANILVAPPASERRNADTKECRCLFFADISVANLLLSCWQRPKSSDHPASKLLDEFLFSQRSNCWALLTKDASERVRYTIPNGLDALLKANKFLLNLKLCLCPVLLILTGLKVAQRSFQTRVAEPPLNGTNRDAVVMMKTGERLPKSVQTPR